MQAYLADLSKTRRNTPSFYLCQRVFLKVQNIIFSDPPVRPRIPYGCLNGVSPRKSRFWKRKVKPRIAPTIVGLGSLLAGAPGMPRLAAYAGSVAIEQGRIADGVTESRSIRMSDDDDDAPASTSTKDLEMCETESPEPEGGASGEEEEVEEEDVSRGILLGGRRSVGPSATSPSLIGHWSRGFKSDHTSSPSHSSPSLLPAPPSPPVQNVVDAALQRLDLAQQSQLLQSHYCRSEVRFLLALESISNRLLVLPKLAVRTTRFLEHYSTRSFSLSFNHEEGQCAACGAHRTEPQTSR